MTDEQQPQQDKQDQKKGETPSAAPELSKDQAQAQVYVTIALDLLGAFGPAHACGISSLVAEAAQLDKDNADIQKLHELVKAAVEKPAPVEDDLKKKLRLAVMFNNAGNYITREYGDFDAVRSLWEKAFSLMPDEAPIRYNMSLCCYDNEEYEAADGHIAAALQSIAVVPVPENEQEKQYLSDSFSAIESHAGLVQSRLGRHEAAVLLLQDKFGKDKRITAGMCHAYGVSLAALGRKDESVRFLEMAVDMERTKARKDEYRDRLKEITGSGMTGVEKMIQQIKEIEKLTQKVKDQIPGSGGPSVTV